MSQPILLSDLPEWNCRLVWRCVAMLRRHEDYPGTLTLSYWSANRELQADWLQQLEFCDRSGIDSTRLITEITLSEMTARLWCGFNRLSPNDDGTHDGRFLMEQVLGDFLLIRNSTYFRRQPAAGKLERITGRWADLLLAPLHRFGNVADYAVDADRLFEFAEDDTLHAEESTSSVTGSLYEAGIRSAFTGLIAPTATVPNALGRWLQRAEERLSLFAAAGTATDVAAASASPDGDRRPRIRISGITDIGSEHKPKSPE